MSNHRVSPSSYYGGRCPFDQLDDIKEYEHLGDFVELLGEIHRNISGDFTRVVRGHLKKVADMLRVIHLTSRDELPMEARIGPFVVQGPRGAIVALGERTKEGLDLALAEYKKTLDQATEMMVQASEEADRAADKIVRKAIADLESNGVTSQPEPQTEAQAVA